MNINFKDETQGVIESVIFANDQRVLFGSGPSVYVKKERKNQVIPLLKTSDGFSGSCDNIEYGLNYGFDEKGSFYIDVSVRNSSAEPYSPQAIGIKLGVETRMVDYPQWNDAFFPNILRCEKNCFFGCFISPTGKRLAVVSTKPIAAWEMDYNKISGVDEDSGYFGHRILNADLLLTCAGPLPERYPQNLKGLNPKEVLNRRIVFFPLPNDADFYEEISFRYGIPVVISDKYTVAKNERFKIKVLSNGKYDLRVTSPSGVVSSDLEVDASEYGYYDICVTDESGKQATAKVYCRREYSWYLKKARENVADKPQRATVCCESWYGYYTAFLAKKHYPEPILDEKIKKAFDEVSSYLFDFESGEVKVMPQRIQNTATGVGVLVDLYESDPENNAKYLDYADLLAENLLKRQSPDGAFRKGNEHYTCVIYIAKSLLELALCEKKLSADAVYRDRYLKHYSAVKRAIDDLCLLKERIGTEGEHTLEDGMISCSALQIAFFALTLPKEERTPYISAAEYMISVHRCLEQNYSPDTRTRGATLRFWEAQFDVLTRGNAFSSPHGWSSWKNYATYYLYLLTGKKEYLRQTIDSVGACLQTIDEGGNLRWAFVTDPYLNLKVFVPNEDKIRRDGYENLVNAVGNNYEGKFVTKIFGECYVDMISGWYRIGENAKVTGGYKNCALIYEDHVTPVDDQGGCCDNDVHEHFKCLEETLLNKAFLIIDENGRAEAFNCGVTVKDGAYAVSFTEECEFLHVNASRAATISADGVKYGVDSFSAFIDVKNQTIIKV